MSEKHDWVVGYSPEDGTLTGQGCAKCGVLLNQCLGTGSAQGKVKDLESQVFHLKLQIKQMNEKQRMHLATKVMETMCADRETRKNLPTHEIAGYAFRVADAMLERAKK